MYIENREMYVVIFLFISLLFLFLGSIILVKWKLINKKKSAIGIILIIIGLLSAWLTYTVSGINETKKTTQNMQVVSNVEEINFKKDVLSLQNLKEYFESLYGEAYILYAENDELRVTLKSTLFEMKLHNSESAAQKEFEEVYSNLPKEYIQKDENIGNKRFCVTYKYKTLYRNSPWRSAIVYRYKNLTFNIVDLLPTDKDTNQDVLKILDALLRVSRGENLKSIDKGTGLLATP